ncbi:MAG: ABC transporter ATP-binding protein [Thermoanaerobaculaceae bacterium]|nr:ABC transporter ATP-binding protein [Thermoanaerobaculaceae bacterium]
MADESVLSARGLVVRYGGVEAVKGLDLQVPRGQVIGLIGPDGAGKTSSLRVFAGLLRATAGTVEVLGRDAWRHRRALHHRLGYLAQRFALYGDLTVDENVQFFALLLGVNDWRARRDMLLERVALAEFRDRQADRLSGGMRQKLALACSLMHSPDILVLDEPTTGVDPVTRREFWRLLADLVAEGLTLVIATPYLDEAERCSRVVLMHQGRVLADAPPAELRALLPGVIVEVAAQPRTLVAGALARVQGVVDVRPFAARFHVRLSSAEGAVDLLRQALEGAGATVEEVRVIPAGLEDTFLHLTRANERASGEAA